MLHIILSTIGTGPTVLVACMALAVTIGGPLLAALSGLADQLF